MSYEIERLAQKLETMNATVVSEAVAFDCHKAAALLRRLIRVQAAYETAMMAVHWTVGEGFTPNGDPRFCDPEVAYLKALEIINPDDPDSEGQRIDRLYENNLVTEVVAEMLKPVPHPGETAHQVMP